jgi:hypothetical protein
MYDYSYVLGLLRANAADLERRALSGEKTKIARMVRERSLRNRALAITHRLQGMVSFSGTGLSPKPSAASSRLRPPGCVSGGRTALRASPPSIP